MNFDDNSKKNNQKIDFSFDSTEAGGVCISSVGKKPESDIFSSSRSISKFNINAKESHLFPMEEAILPMFTKRRILPMFMRRGVYFQRNGEFRFLW